MLLTTHHFNVPETIRQLNAIPTSGWGFGAFPPHEHHCHVPDLSQINDLAHQLRATLADELALWGATIGPRQRMYITRVGGANSSHVDSMLTWGARRTYRVGLLYTTTCEGGVLHCDGEEVAPSPGLIVTFPVRLSHHVTTVTRGERRVVRFDIIA